jgi:hypothetical protein
VRFGIRNSAECTLMPCNYLALAPGSFINIQRSDCRLERGVEAVGSSNVSEHAPFAMCAGDVPTTSTVSYRVYCQNLTVTVTGLLGCEMFPPASRATTWIV